MLVGREGERRRLDAVVAAARLGQSGVLVLTGEPGIGKTALLEYAQERAGSMRVLTVTGSEAERDLPFAGLAQLLRLTDADLARLPEPQAQALGAALALRAGSGADRFAVGAGLLTLLAQTSEDQPVLLRIDDAHLLDLATQEALAFVARRLLADAVALVASARTNEPCRLVTDDLPRLVLGGLDVDATRELAAAAGSSEPGAGLAARLHTLTGGNPLAVRELVRDTDRLLALPPDAPAPIPATLSALYARRANGLDDAARTAVVLAAAAGEDLATVARACAQLGVPVAALQAAEDAGLVVVSDDRVTFTHPLVRSGLYALASPGRRRQLHAAIADALPDAEADRRAWHRCAAVLGPDEDTAQEMAAVAGRAARRGAYAVAAAAAERAAALSPDPGRRSARWLTAGTLAWQGGDGARALDLLDRAGRLDPDAAVPAPAGLLRGVIAARCGAVDEARDLLLAAGDASTDPYARVSCYAEAVYACFYLGDARGALAAATRIETVLEDGADERSTTLGLVAAGMGRILAGLDGAHLIKEALTHEPVRVPTDGGLGDGGLGDGGLGDGGLGDGGLDDGSWRALGPLFVRDATTGRALIRQVLADRRAQSAVGSLPHLLFHLARDAATTDRWTQAGADYAEAIGLSRELGQTTELSTCSAGLAWLEARQGRDEARAHAAEALDLADRFHLRVPEVWARLALADLALGSGDVADAAARYAAVEDRLTALGLRDVDLSPLPELVETLLRLGERRRADAAAQEYAVRAADKGQPWACARAARTRALLGRDDEVDALFGEAVRLHAATLDAYEEARTRLAWGARLRRQRRRVDAREPLRLALETFTRLGARPWAETAADELAATGLTVTRPGESPLSALTPRELQIAALLGEGRTTRQVATALFLSPKTVEYHLRHVYAKLAVASRAELAVVLAGLRG